MHALSIMKAYKLKKGKMRHLFFFLIFIAAEYSFATIPLKDGLLSLPTSQQLSHLFSTGANIVDAHDLLAVSSVYYARGQNKNFLTITPGILYGISNDFSLFVNIPIAPENKLNGEHSSGIEDIFIQGEYAYFHKSSDHFFLEGTVVGTLYLPTGSTKKKPPTGAGSLGFLLGTTLSYTGKDWYWFLSPFILFNSRHHGSRFGNQFLYQGGVARNIISKPDRFITAFLIGFYGIKSQEDTLKNVKNMSSGGNSCYVGPSLWFSTQRFTSQAGIMFAAAQHLNGQQNKNKYIVGIDLRWKFNNLMS